MQGKIIKGIAGFYYVHANGVVYECKAKGVFRNRKIKPLVGDNVDIEVIDDDKSKGNIVDILTRKNELIRPASANIDQAMIIFAVANPQPNFNLLDKFLVMMDYQSVPTIICFNKADLITQEEQQKLKAMYKECGCTVIFTSTLTNQGIDEMKEKLEHKTTVLAGASGVGKSTITNLILPEANMETGSVSKIGRGRHTTRHSEIFNVHGDTYIMDTPGFTSLNLPQVEKEDIHLYFPEYEKYEGTCRFNGCVHVNEPDCSVKQAVIDGAIDKHRYDSYVDIYNELKAQKKY